MPKRSFDSPDALRELVSQEISVTDWFNTSQDRIQQFADATLDHQWIHIDVERARRESPFHAPIAHGFLTLSLLSHLMHEAIAFEQNPRMAVNYGLNKVRFISPVKAGTNIRARVTLLSVEETAGKHMDAIFNVTIETEGGDKPSCVAEWIVRYYL